MIVLKGFYTFRILCLLQIISTEKIYWLIALNGMSTHLGLFHAQRLGNYFHSNFISTFVVYFLKSLLNVFIYQVFLSNTNNVHTVIWFQVFLLWELDLFPTGG